MFTYGDLQILPPPHPCLGIPATLPLGGSSS